MTLRLMGHEMIVWNNELVTGITEMDEQHKILVNHINAANTRLNGLSVNATMLEKITQDLLSYALYHFETEGLLMQQYHYASCHKIDAETHWQEHREFSAKVVEIREKIRSGASISRDELLVFLNNWLINHIMNTDKKLAAFVCAKQGENAQ